MPGLPLIFAISTDNYEFPQALFLSYLFAHFFRLSIFFSFDFSPHIKIQLSGVDGFTSSASISTIRLLSLKKENNNSNNKNNIIIIITIVHHVLAIRWLLKYLSY